MVECFLRNVLPSRGRDRFLPSPSSGNTISLRRHPRITWILPLPSAGSIPGNRTDVPSGTLWRGCLPILRVALTTLADSSSIRMAATWKNDVFSSLGLASMEATSPGLLKNCFMSSGERAATPPFLMKRLGMIFVVT